MNTDGGMFTILLMQSCRADICRDQSVASSRIQSYGSICAISWYSVSNECQTHSNQIREAVYLRSRVRSPEIVEMRGCTTVNAIYSCHANRKRVLHTSVAHR